MGDNTIKVKVGQTLSQGALIGGVGNTGNARGKNGGYHLHIETSIDGKNIDPSEFDAKLAEIQSENKADTMVSDEQYAALLQKTLSGGYQDIGVTNEEELQRYLKDHGMVFNADKKTKIPSQDINPLMGH